MKAEGKKKTKTKTKESLRSNQKETQRDHIFFNEM